MLRTLTAPSSSISVRIVCNSCGLNSLYHRYCHVTSLMTDAIVSRVTLFFSNTRSTPASALGLNRSVRHARYASTASSLCCSRSASAPKISHSSADFL